MGILVSKANPPILAAGARSGQCRSIQLTESVWAFDRIACVDSRMLLRIGMRLASRFVLKNQIQSGRQVKNFELSADVVRERLAGVVRSIPGCSSSESTVGRFKDFVRLELSGPKGSARLTIVVNAVVGSFEFAIGEYIYYEGDYDPYEPGLDFLDDLIQVVLRGRVEEWRYFVFSPRIGKPSKVSGIVNFSRNRPYRFTRSMGVTSILSFRRCLHRYQPYSDEVLSPACSS